MKSSKSLVSKSRYVAAYSFAIVYASLGDKDQAFQWLEKSYHDKAPDVVYLKVNPFVDNLRSDSRFQKIIHRVGLPE